MYKILTYYIPQTNVVFLYGKKHELNKKTLSQFKSLRETIEKEIQKKTILQTEKMIYLENLKNKNYLSQIQSPTDKVEGQIEGIGKEIKNMDYIVRKLTNIIARMSVPVVLVNKHDGKELTFECIDDNRLEGMLKGAWDFKQKEDKKRYLNDKIKA